MRNVIFLLLLIFVNCSDEEDETVIMNTVCIDGVRHLSVINGTKCSYVPLSFEEKKCK